MFIKVTKIYVEYIKVYAKMSCDVDIAALLPKSYKCHPSSKVNFVVCIICEDVYHLSDFNRLKKVKFISDIFAVCNAHQDLTSNLDNLILDQQSRAVIAEIKQNEIKRAHEKLYQDVENSLSDRKINSHNNTTMLDDDPDLRAVLTENILLKQLNEELKHKNSLLLDKIDLMGNNKPTYVEAFKKKPTRAGKIPDIKIKQKSKTISNDDVTKKVNSTLKNNLILPYEKVVQTNKNGTIVKCIKEDDVDRTCSKLKEVLGQDYDVSVEQPVNPKVKVFGISNDFETNEELETDINGRNFYQFDNKCKVLHIFNCANNNKGAIIELPSNLYEFLVDNKFKIYIGYQCCKAFDTVNISICSKCSRYNHSAKKCSNVPKCAMCAGDHIAQECKNKQIACANCIYANISYGHSYDTNHRAGDLNCCEILKKKMNILMSNIAYISKPKLPNYIGPKAPSNDKKDNENNVVPVSSADKSETSSQKNQTIAVMPKKTRNRSNQQNNSK